MDALIDIQAVAAEAFATLDPAGQIEPFLAENAYRTRRTTLTDKPPSTMRGPQ